MAQAGYTPILIYASGTATNIPTAGNLISGSSGAELAINYADGKLYYKDGSGNVKLLSIGYGSSSVTPTNGGVQYGTGTALALTAAGSSGQILRSNGAAAPTWADLSTLGVNTISFGTTGLTPNSATAGAVTVAGTLVTANGGTGLGGATPFTANGVLYASSASALTSGSALTFDGNAVRNNQSSGTNSYFRTTSGTVDAYFGAATAGIATGVVVGSFSNNDVVFYQNSTEQMRLTSTGLKSSIAGTNADPVFSYTSDTNTGIFFPAADKLGFTAGGGTDQMVLTTTGLGIGTSSPSYKLDVSGYIRGLVNTSSVGNASSMQLTQNGTGDAAVSFLIGSTTEWLLGVDNSASDAFKISNITGGSDFTSTGIVLDTSGNLGLGVTPSAWGSAYRTAFQVGSAASLAGVAGTGASDYFSLMGNAYLDSAPGYRYIRSATAVRYEASGGEHRWYYAPSGFGYGTAATSLTSTQNGNSYTIVSAGTTDFTLIGAANNNVGTTFTKSGGTGTGTGTVSQAITFTQAMTLDASGNLLVGLTSSAFASGGGVHINNPASADTRLRLTNAGTSTGSYDGFDLAITSAGQVNLVGWENQPMAFLTNATERARITSGGDFFIGNGETAASPSAGILSATGGTGTNIAGANLTIRGGASTGSGAGGVIVFSTAAAGASGTTVRSASERARITSEGVFVIGTNNNGLEIVPGAVSGTPSRRGIKLPDDPDGYFDFYVNSYQNNPIFRWKNGDGGANAMTLNGVSGDLAVVGALSKGSGSFKIDHPLKPITHHLVHSFIEGPQADLIYRGKIELVEGHAKINIDSVSGMTEGTFVALCREVQCFTSNESDWDAVKGSVNGNILTIQSQNINSSAIVSWMVIGERQDQHMYDTEWTDENGKVIVEPEKTTT